MSAGRRTLRRCRNRDRLAALVGVPGFASFWTLVMSVFVGVPRRPAVGLIVMIGWDCAVAAHGQIATAVGSSRASPGDAERVDDLSAALRNRPITHSFRAFVPLVALSFVLGLCPGPLLAVTTTVAEEIASDLAVSLATARNR